MPLRPQKSLEEMIVDVLEGIGEGGTGVASAADRSMVAGQLRRAQTLIRQEANWTINRVSTEVALPAGETAIDWPDDTGPGEIERIAAHITTNPQYEWDLVGGISTDDRSLWLNRSFSPSTFCPYKYDIRDEVIEVGPASTQDTTLRLEYLLGDEQLTDPGSRPRCDSTAVAMRAEILVRNIRGGDFREGIPLLEATLARYLDLIKPKQGGAKRAIQPGRAWADNDPARRGNLSGQRHWAFRNRRP